MSDDLVSRLRQDAEMLQDGPQSNLTKLWHSEVVKDAAKDCQEAATAIERLEARVKELEATVSRIKIQRDNALLDMEKFMNERNEAFERAAAIADGFADRSIHHYHAVKIAAGIRQLKEQQG